jgi:hypothetical protein
MTSNLIQLVLARALKNQTYFSKTYMDILSLLVFNHRVAMGSFLLHSRKISTPTMHDRILL